MINDSTLEDIRDPRCENIAGVSYIRGDVTMQLTVGVVKVGKIGFYLSFLFWRFRGVFFELVNITLSIDWARAQVFFEYAP